MACYAPEHGGISVMPTAARKKGHGTVIVPKKEYDSLKKAAEELDTLKAILLYEEEKNGGKLRSFKNVRDLIDDLDR
jgi:hypothetical protein